MNAIDNFDLLAKALFPEDGKCPEGEFYFVQILVRGKDGNHVNGNNKNRLVRYYVVHSVEKLMEIKQEVHDLCFLHNARAYIHPTPRNDKEVAAIMMEEAMHEFVVGNYHVFRRLYSTACGKSYVQAKKLFVIDVDKLPDESSGDFAARFDKIADMVEACRGKTNPNAGFYQKVVMSVPTKSGAHLITMPFDVGQFTEVLKEARYPAIDVHKNNPTVLYCFKD